MQLYPISRKSASVALLLLVAILVASIVRYALSPFEVEVADSIYRERTITLVLAAMLAIYGGVIEGKMFPRSGLSKGYCTLPLPLYGLLSCGIFFAPDAIETIFVSVSLALSLYLLLRSLHSAGEKDSVFFASILLGLTILVNPSCVVLAGVIPLSIFILALSLRQIFLMVLGYVLPFAAASYAMWYGGGELWDFGRNVVEALSRERLMVVEQIPYVGLLMVLYVAIVLLGGMVYMALRPDKMFLLSRVRRALSLFVSVLFLTLSMLFLPSTDLSVFAVVAVPTTILLSMVLSFVPTNFSTIAYWVLLLLFVLHLFVA